LPRFRKFLLDRHMLTEAEDKHLQAEVAAEIQAAIESYEALPPQNPRQLFNLVYADMPPQLRQQQEALLHDLEPTPAEPSRLHPEQRRELVPELELA
jgi:TPP-dependent pyruvate/acetoin dehydrogenase alpha subunit